jgi:hypothetical protein
MKRYLKIQFTKPEEIDIVKYDALINKIQDYKILDANDYEFIGSLPKKFLLEIIKYYDSNTKCVNQYFEYLSPS